VLETKLRSPSAFRKVVAAEPRWRHPLIHHRNKGHLPGLLLQPLLAPGGRDPTGAATLRAGLATERQAALNIAFALTDRALCQRWFWHVALRPRPKLGC
jgi:hypothetical protein